MFLPWLQPDKDPEFLSVLSFLDAYEALSDNPFRFTNYLVGSVIVGSAMIVGLEVLSAMPNAWNMPPPTKR